MSTLFSDVLTQYAMQFIDDVRWQEQLALNPAQFFRAKSQTLISAIPRFNRPPNIQSFLSYTKPSWDDYTHTITEEDTFPLTVQTGKAKYDLCSVGYVTEDSVGGVTYTPVTDFTYTSFSGDVTITTELPVGTEVEFDFYTDGVFDNTLDPTQMRILGLCVAYDWYYRFENAFLNVLNPITDKTFNPRSATAEDKRANTGRYAEIGRQLSSELIAYEQRLYALKYIPQSGLNGLINTFNANPSTTDSNVWIDGNTIYIQSRRVNVSDGTIERD